jgi:hypothetical protein
MKNNITKMIEDFALSDFGVILDVSEKKSKDGISLFNYIYNKRNFSYSSSHLNINIIVSDLITTLIEKNIKNFKFKLQNDIKLRTELCSVFSDKFNHCSWTIGTTWFYPAKNEYKTEVILQGKKIIYSYNGDIDHINRIDIIAFFLNNHIEYLL